MNIEVSNIQEDIKKSEVGMVNLIHYDKATVFQGLYNNAKPVVAHLKEYDNRNMTIDEAREILSDNDLKFGTFKGRALNIDMSKNEIDIKGYNFANGNNAAESVFKKLPYRFDTFYNEFVLKGLAQGKNINRDNARMWYESILQNEVERFWWHYKRLSGLGGSDIGEVATWKLGELNMFKTPRDIVREKLMEVPVEGQTKAMRRGTLLEPVLQQIFCEDYDAISRQDIVNKIQNTVSKDHPWMGANVDDVVEIDGKIYIVDYKCSAHLAKEAPLPYEGQLHQYDFMLSLANGKHSLRDNKSGSDGLMLCYFDYASGGANPIDVPFNPEMVKAVLEGGDEVWGHVLSGTYPEVNRRDMKKIEYSDEQIEQISDLEKRVVSLNTISKVAEELAQEAQEEMAALISLNGEVDALKGLKPPFSTLTMMVRSNLDMEAWTDIQKRLKVDSSKISKTTTKLDDKKVKEFLKANKQKIKDYYKEDIDVEKIKEICLQEGIEPPTKDKPSFSVRSNNKKVDIIGLENTKNDYREVLETLVEKTYKSTNFLKTDLEEDLNQCGKSASQMGLSL